MLVTNICLYLVCMYRETSVVIATMKHDSNKRAFGDSARPRTLTQVRRGGGKGNTTD